MKSFCLLFAAIISMVVAVWADYRIHDGQTVFGLMALGVVIFTASWIIDAPNRRKKNKKSTIRKSVVESPETIYLD